MANGGSVSALIGAGVVMPDESGVVTADAESDSDAFIVITTRRGKHREHAYYRDDANKFPAHISAHSNRAFGHCSADGCLDSLDDGGGTHAATRTHRDEAR